MNGTIKRLIMLLFTSLLLVSCNEKAYVYFEKHQDLTPTNASQIKNVIFLIADGGGFANMDLTNEVKKAGGIKTSHLSSSATKVEAGELFLNNYLVGNVTTHCSDNAVTDSGASATAMSTGYKALKYSLGLDQDSKPKATILEAAQLIGKSTGIVSTIRWSHATPAAYAVHTTGRNDYWNVGEQFTNQEIDVVMGTNFSKSLYGTTEYATKRSYQFIDNKIDLEKTKPGDKVWAGIVGELPYDYALKEDQPNLATMTEAAIRCLSDNENGFFLMVEASHIDTAAANSDSFKMVSDTLAFDAAFESAVDYASQRNDTIVIATADHDTGGLVLPEGQELVEAVEEICDGQNTTKVTWSSSGNHTSRNVGVYMYLPENTVQISNLSTMDNRGDNSTNRTDKTIDNTDYAPYIASLWGISMDDVNKELFVDVTDQGSYNEETREFTFNDGKKMFANQSWYTKKNKTFYTHGQVSCYVEGSFYVPAIVLE